MKELNDINLGSNMIVLKDNRVTSSILPKKTSELDQNITIEENVIIEGAVYSSNLEINNGPAEFHGAVFASNELHVKNNAKELVYFYKSVASTNSIVSLLTEGMCIFGGDINSPNVKLKNCFVCGSIYGTEIELENCVVLGGVFASRKFVFHNCIAGTFNAPEVNAGGINSLLYPTAFSVEPLSFIPGTELWNLSLADLGSLFKGQKELPNTGKIPMDFTKDTQRTVLTDENGAKMLVNSYSVAGKVLVSDMVNLDRLENHFLIVSASLGSQMLKQYSLSMDNGQKGPELDVKGIASFFFSLLTGEITVQEISGEVSFDELKKNFE